MADKTFPEYLYAKIEAPDSDDCFVGAYEEQNSALDSENVPEQIATYKLVSTKTLVRKSVIEEVTED